MENFFFSNPTELHFGRGVIQHLGTEVLKRGSRILLVYGKGSIKSNGVYEQVIDTLTNHHVEIFEHPGVSGNPLLSHTREGVKKAKQFQVDLIVAVGGGSVIDEAKAIALGALSNSDIWDFYTKKETPQLALPIISVLTLPATGSEMNGFTVLTNDETCEKFALGASPLLNPKVSLLDPESTFSLSLQQTAFACADIISHLTEGYFTTTASVLPLQDNLIKGLFHAVLSAMRMLIKDPRDYNARASFMWTATLAWNGIAQVGIPGRSMPCHALEMPLSGLYNIAHGAGLSIITPHWLNHSQHLHLKRIESFGEEILGETTTIPEVIKTFSNIYSEIGAPISMREAGLINPDIDALTKMALTTFESRNMTGYDMDLIRNIYEDAI